MNTLVVDIQGANCPVYRWSECTQTHCTVHRRCTVLFTRLLYDELVLYAVHRRTVLFISELSEELVLYTSQRTASTFKVWPTSSKHQTSNIKRPAWKRALPPKKEQFCHASSSRRNLSSKSHFFWHSRCGYCLLPVALT